MPPDALRPSSGSSCTARTSSVCSQPLELTAATSPRRARDDGRGPSDLHGRPGARATRRVDGRCAGRLSGTGDRRGIARTSRIDAAADMDRRPGQRPASHVGCLRSIGCRPVHQPRPDRQVASGTRPATMRPDHIQTWGESVTRRFALILVALASTASLVLAACSSTPAAPALTDPKEILAADRRQPEGRQDGRDHRLADRHRSRPPSSAARSTSRRRRSAPRSTSRTRRPSSASTRPSLMGTKIDAVLARRRRLRQDRRAARVDAGVTPGKYTKAEVPTSSGEPVTDPAEIAKAVDEIKAALDKLPTPPTKGADEKCGDQDCYHVTIEGHGRRHEGARPGERRRVRRRRHDRPLVAQERPPPGEALVLDRRRPSSGRSA